MSELGLRKVSTRCVELEFRLVKFRRGGVGRYMLINKKTYTPCIAASIYEASYSKGSRRYKATIQTVMYHVAFLFTWGEIFSVDIERMLISGEGIDFRTIKKFADWLGCVIAPSSDGAILNQYVTKVLASCSSFSLWFVRNYTPLVSSDAESNVSYIALIDSHRACWSGVMVGGTKNSVAPDLTDAELDLVEQFLKRQLYDLGNNYAVCLRNYILWRLIKGFGLRIGEALALRLQDLKFTGADPSLEVVRIDERGVDYEDPRTPNSPKVKTFGRLLYFAPEDEDLIDLIEEYISSCRFEKSEYGMSPSFFLDHDFLFVAHGAGTQGSALSSSAASKVAKKIGELCLDGFHWHILRHAYFNRRYEAASLIPNNSTEIDHIVYIGGWSSPLSLKHYARRAIRDMSRVSLIDRNAGAIKNDC